MSIRVDSSPLISGAVVVGDPGLGVFGSAVPSTGDHGAGFIYADLSLPSDAGKEVRGHITSWPSAGTLTAYEDTSFVFDGPDGEYSFTYTLYVDGASAGSATVNLSVGASSVTADGELAAVTLAAPVGAATGAAAASGALAAITLTPATGTASGGTSIPATGDGALAGIALSAPTGSATGAATGDGALSAITLTAIAGDASGGAGSVAVTADGALADITLSRMEGAASGAATAYGALAWVTIGAFSGSAANSHVQNHLRLVVVGESRTYRVGE